MLWQNAKQDLLEIAELYKDPEIKSAYPDFARFLLALQVVMGSEIDDSLGYLKRTADELDSTVTLIGGSLSDIHTELESIAKSMP